MYNILKFFWKQNIPRWSILIIDLFISAFSLTLAILLRFNFERITEPERSNLPKIFLLVVGVRAITFLISKTYKGVIRYTGAKDATRIFNVIVLGSLIFSVCNLITFYIAIGINLIPYSIIIIDALVTMAIMIVSRLALKAIYFENTNPETQK